MSDFFNNDFFNHSRSMAVELAGAHDDLLKAVQTITGKRVYNTEYQGKDGRIYVKLVIE